MTTLKDYLHDFALDVINNVVICKRKDEAAEYDEEGLEDLKTQFIEDVSHDLLGRD